MRDSITEHQGEYELSDAERREIVRRMKAFDAALKRERTWEELRDSIQSRRRSRER